MGYLNKTIFPGPSGMVFTINVQNTEDIEQVRLFLLRQPGIKRVIFNREVYPYEMTVNTDRAVRLDDFQDMIKQIGFQAIHKTVNGVD